MIDTSGQRKPLQAAQAIEFGALRISSERDGDVVAICVSGAWPPLAVYSESLSASRHAQTQIA
jgi:hypothetical protein